MESFIARQPIFDRDLNVYGYELLFRSGLVNACTEPDLDRAASKVIADSLQLTSIETLTGGRKAFINLTREVLVQEFSLALPRGLTVLEILEGVAPDEEVLHACERLKEAGFGLALDDFVYKPESEPLVRMADVVKVDFLSSKPPERESMARRLAPRGIELLAEKLETQAELENARKLGYKFFQGYFFARPSILATRDIPGSKLQYLRILQEIHRRDVDFRRIEEIIRHDLSLCYKFLRYVNSAYFGWVDEVRNIRQALQLLGEKEVRKWVTLVVMATMAEDKPHELIVTAITRARFCELVAPVARLASRADDLFLAGMLSLLDAVLDRPLPSVLSELPIDRDIRSALLEDAGPLRDTFACVLAYERGDWDAFSRWAAGLAVDEGSIPALHRDAVEWGRRAFG